MEEATVKQGMLYLQQQTAFGKKWKKVWAVLYRETNCSIARLEYFEGASGPEKIEKNKKGENKKVIRLCDCIRVVEISDNSPKETTAFLLETTNKLLVFAADNAVQNEWIQTLCEVTFQKNRSLDAGNDNLSQSKSSKVSMEENSLYSTREQVKEFKVTARRTEATDRCQLRGTYILKADNDSLVIKDTKTGGILYTWPYRFLRRFGRDKVTFSFEAGRRCASGEGNFEFETKQGNDIFQAIEEAINVHKMTTNEMPAAQREIPAIINQEVYEDAGLDETGHRMQRFKNDLANKSVHSTGTRCLSLESGQEAKSASLKSRPVKPLNSCPLPSAKGVLPSEPMSDFLQPPPMQSLYSEASTANMQLEPNSNKKVREKSKKNQGSPRETQIESDYAVPFDTIAKSLMANFPFNMPESSHAKDEDLFSPPPAVCESQDPLYDSIDEMNLKDRGHSSRPVFTKSYHIYDEPEGCAGVSVYDEPEEVKGHAWKLQATEQDPPGHEYPYNPHVDDYAVPRKAVSAAQLNYYTEDTQHEDQQEDEDIEECEYDNVILKFADRRTE
ncbi:docking protein 2 [Protopterus annectens]|uniref:docking protein 2 n=1 Tax=Protopterus annectens TaxID=7888 RepID=UPI001CFB4B39|nr:docking protein 2 [Protopterus annectens]